jgi:hypothetical protein
MAKAAWPLSLFGQRLAGDGVVESGDPEPARCERFVSLCDGLLQRPLKLSS